MTLSRSRIARLTTVSACLLVFTLPTVVFGQTPPAAPYKSAAELRQQIRQLKDDRQLTERELSLKQAAATVSAQRVEELKKQLLAVESRAMAEAADAAKLREKSQQLEQQLVRFTADLPAHESADAAVAAADRAKSRLDALQSARRELQTQLAGLRKSSVEWRSRGAEAEQQVAALVAQRPELEKKSGEAKAALDKAEMAVTAAKTASTAAAAAYTAAAAAVTETETRSAEAVSAAERMLQSVGSLEKSLTTLQEAARLTGVDAAAAIQSLQKTIADFAPVKTANTALQTELATVLAERQKQMAAAKAEQDTKAAELAMAEQSAAPLRAAATAAAEAVAGSVTKEAQLKQLQSDSGDWQRTLMAQLDSLEPSLPKLDAELQIATAETLVLQRTAEQALEPLGRFVSFSRHVAPIFAKRCVACHNTRSPGGRLNLDSFAALQKGGESGAVVTAHKTADSLLISEVESGSMPKEAEPLQASEIAVLKHWIEVGAPLDAGVSLTADLFDVVPEFSQPQPPAEYRAPIPVTAIAFSPDGSQLASSGYHEVLVWNTADGTLIRRVSNLAERIHDIEYSADGTRLLVAAGTPGQLGELKLFTVADGTLIRTLVRSRDSIFAAAFSPDQNRAACAGADRAIVVTDLNSGEQVLKIEDHADWVMDINWSPNGQRLVSASKDKTCKVFDAATGNPVVTFPGHGEPAYSAAFLADGNTVASGGGDKRVRIWQAADAKEVRGIGGFGGDVFRIHVAAGDLLYSASGDGNVHLHKAADGAAVRKYAGHRDWVYSVAESPGRKLVAAGSYDGEVRTWNAEDAAPALSFTAIPGTRTVAAAGQQTPPVSQ